MLAIRIAFASLLFSLTLAVPAMAQPRRAVAEVARQEVARAESDFAAGGPRKLAAGWNACLDDARANENANAAQRCILYGLGAARLIGDDPAGGGRRGRRTLTQDALEQGQNDMLEIMDIPEEARPAWLDRYRRFVSGIQLSGGGTDPIARDSDPPGRPSLWPRAGGGWPGPRGVSDDVGPEAAIDLAHAAAGKYPPELLHDPVVAGALRRLVGPADFARLSQFSAGPPVVSYGRFAVGLACVPRACGMSEARFVFAGTNAFLGVIDGDRMRVYGAPPRPVLGLLLRDPNGRFWRGTVEDMGRPPALVPVTADTPRMTVAPRGGPVWAGPGPAGPAWAGPVSADPPQRPRADGDTTEIPLRRWHDSLVVSVLVNNTVTVPFMVDSGASDVSISAGVMQRLIEAGTLTRADFRGKASYTLADGSRTTNDTFRLHSLRIGDREVRDVLASVTNDSDGLLLGQTFLTRFRSWSIDNQRQVLVLR